MTVQAGDIIQVVAVLQNEDNNIVQNRFHFRCTGSGTPTDGAFNLAMHGLMTTLYQYFDEEVSNQYDALNLKIDKIFFTGGTWETVANIYNGVWLSPPVFSNVGSPLPPGVAGLVRGVTGLAKHTGKKFIAGLVENTSGATAKLETAVANKLIQMMTDWGTENVLAGLDLSVWGVVLDTTNGTVRDPIAFSSTGVWSYQRRRRTGVGI